MIDIAVVGDLVLDEPDADHWLSGIAPVLRQCELAIGHLEVPHCGSGEEVSGDVPAPAAPPENIAAIARAGIAMVSMAGNHMADCGSAGIAETIDLLDAAGIAHAGGGMDLPAARKPALARVAGKTIALLSYNCVGPEFGWAGSDKPGCAFLPVGTRDGSPVSPAADLESLLPMALEIMGEDIALARAAADFVIVALHQGKVHTPAHIEPYERAAARAAIDLGADAVIAHHAHIVRGISYYQGKPVFHGLGNGCVVTTALAPDQDHAARREWAERRKAMFGFEPDPAYRLAPFHPEAVNAFIGKLHIDAAGKTTASIVPVFVEAPGRPVVAHGDRARTVADYVERITRTAGLPPIRIHDSGLVEEVA